MLYHKEKNVFSFLVDKLFLSDINFLKNIELDKLYKFIYYEFFIRITYLFIFIVKII